MKTALLALVALTMTSACAHGPPPLADSGSWTRAADPVDVRIDLAEAMVRTDRPDSALKIIRKARDEGLAGSDLTVVQARALLAKGLDGESEALLDGVLQSNPRHAGALAALGILYLDQKRTDAAADAFERAARRNPEDADLLNNLGFALLVSKRYVEAEAALREATRIDPASDRARNNLGFALAALGRIQEARQAFLAVVSPEDAEHNLRLAARLYPPNMNPETP
ncbi:MAG: tetratricopeptide repeat protein [Deltaproteobacteria bacterium]|nr:tetratricopeptide repeat protein [Deltaproteobacteria bacterium]